MLTIFPQVNIHQIEKVSSLQVVPHTYSASTDIEQVQKEVSLKTELVQLVDTAINESSFSADLLTQIIVLFKNIEDNSFLLLNGVKLCEYNTKYKPVLDILRKKQCNKGILGEISRVIFKVELLDYMHFAYQDKYDKMHIFQTDFIKLCIEFVSNSDFDLASIIWLKFSRIERTIKPEDVTAILHSVPQNIKMNAFILWLKNFITSLLHENPFCIDVFVKWATDRVFSLEKSPYWPKIGIKFIDEIISVLDLSQKKCITIRPISMDDLDLLKVHIAKILQLKEKYKINMLLSELSCQSPREVALIMLHRCYTEDLEIFLRDYLPVFAIENSLEIDDTLRSYVDREMLNNGGGADDERLRIILDAFVTSTQRLECLLEVLRTVDVPWNNAICELAVNSVCNNDNDFTISETDQQLCYEIKIELNIANLKLILQKYNCPLNCSDYIVLLHKLINAPIVDLNDLKIVLKAMNSYKNYGNMLYIERCLNDSTAKKALEYFKTLAESDKKVLLKSTVSKYECIIKDKNSNALIERSYLDFIKGTGLLSDIRMSKLEDLYHLKTSYDIKMSMNDMSHEKIRVSHISKWFTLSGESTSSGHGICITELARLPHAFDNVLINLLSQSTASVEVQNLIENLIDIFIKNKTSIKKLESIMINIREEKNSLLIENCCKVLVQMINSSPENYLHPLLSILIILNAIIKTSIKLENLTTGWKFQFVFVPISRITSCDELLSMYGNILSHNTLENNQLQSIFVKNDFVPFRILSGYTYFNIFLDLCPENMNEVKKKVAIRFMTKILQSKEIDDLLLTALLLLFTSSFEGDNNECQLFETIDGHDEAVKLLLSKCLSSPIVRSVIALDTPVILHPSSNAPQNLLKQKYDLNLGEFALPDIAEETWDSKIVLFYVLKNYPNTCLQKVVDFSQILNVDIDDGLSLQLISLLVCWELKYSCKIDDFKCRQITYKNNEKQLILDCLLIWESIKDKTFLIDILKDFWKNGEVSLQGRLIALNPYYHEVYLCIYELINDYVQDWMNPKQYFLLQFLKRYERISSPKQYELQHFSVKGMFPEIGHYRLPFQLFMREDMWSNLKLEITLASYQQWLPISTLLCLDTDIQVARDMLCSNAVKQTMTERKRINDIKTNKNKLGHWRLEAKEEPLLRAAHNCVRHIANMEWAAACLFYVLQGCAQGADQVAAAQLCYNFAHRWATVQPANRAVCRMQKLHISLSTCHALHKIDWACDELMQFCSEPTQLVRAIYFHPDYVNKMTRYNVNKTIDDIADKNNINISSIRIQILENILEQSNNDKKNKRDIINLENSEIMRAKCILKATCPKMGAMYLARIALDDETDFNKRKKLRALQCLISIIDPDTALKVTNKDRAALWSTMVDLFYAIRLENVDMPWATASFTNDKLRTLEQIYSTSENRQNVLELAAELTWRYGDERSIRSILPRLLAMSLYNDLQILLCEVIITPDDLVSKAWNAVLVAPFKQADYPVTDRQRSNCLKAVNMLPLCPCISDEVLKEIWTNCLRCKCFAIGCLTLPYMSSELIESLSELRRVDKRNLIAGVKNLQTDSYLVNGALSILDNLMVRKIR